MAYDAAQRPAFSTASRKTQCTAIILSDLPNFAAQSSALWRAQPPTSKQALGPAQWTAFGQSQWSTQWSAQQAALVAPERTADPSSHFLHEETDN